MQLLLVRWLDAQDHSEKWVDEDEAKDFGNRDCAIVSVGFLVSKTARYITIAGDWDEVDKDYGRVTKIPSSMVESIEDITPPDKPTITLP